MESYLTLSQFALAVGDSIRRCPATQGAWIVAELSDVRVSGGHCYMELIEKDARGATVAKMRGMIWASSFYQLRAKFMAATGREIGSGMKVMVRGSATFHNVYGLAVNISDIDPSYTLGDMERLRREILLRLEKEGIINANKGIPLPADLQRIAVISAGGAAGYGDFMKQLDMNARGFRFYTHLFEAVMQGDRTSSSVRAALAEVRKTAHLWDCVVIVRGGGATSDLNGFDDYELARAVALFPLPVLVGIGHERDRTVLDEIANTRLKTPTAVGAFLVDRLTQAWEAALTLTNRIASFAADRIKGEHIVLSHLGASVPMLAKARIADARLRLSRIATGLPAVSSGRIARSLASLDALARMMETAAANRTSTERTALDRLADTLADAAGARLRDAASRLDALASLTDALSPSATLGRGYSITRCGGKTVRSAAHLLPGARIETTLADGTVTSEVTTQ